MQKTVTKRNTLRRINRNLAYTGQKLIASGQGWALKNLDTGTIEDGFDLLFVARDLGSLRPSEVMK